MVCHLVFVRRAREGLVIRPSFRLRGSPVTEIVTIAFLLAVLGLMGNDPEIGRKTLLLVPVIAVLLVAGWFTVRNRVSKTADRELSTFTG
jgi:L-asparagine permease